MEVLFNLYVYASLLSWDTLALLQEVVTPVAQVEHGKYGWENYSRDDIDFLCSGWELVEPGLEEVLSFDPASPTPSELHVDLALMQLAHKALTGTPVAVATTIFTVAPHHRHSE